MPIMLPSFLRSFQAHTLSKGSSFPSTNLIERATHIVFDPDCDDNLPLRSLPLPQHVVSIQWLTDRTLGKIVPERERLEAGLEVEEVEQDELDQEDDEEEDEENDNSSRSLR